MLSRVNRLLSHSSKIGSYGRYFRDSKYYYRSKGKIQQLLYGPHSTGGYGHRDVIKLNNLDDSQITESMINEVTELVKPSINYMWCLNYKPKGKIHEIYKNIIKEDLTRLCYIPACHLDYLFDDLGSEYITPETYRMCSAMKGSTFNRLFRDIIPLYIIMDRNYNILEKSFTRNKIAVSYPEGIYALIDKTNTWYYQRIDVDDEALLIPPGIFNKNNYTEIIGTNVIKPISYQHEVSRLFALE